MSIVTDERVARFVGERCGIILYPPFTCMGVEKEGMVVAGVVFNCFTGFNVEVTIAGHGWTRQFMRDVGRYVFDQLGCIRMTATTEQREVVSIARRLGGKVEGSLRDFYGPGSHATVIGILKKDWIFK